MPGIEEDIQLSEALGLVHTGFRGGAVEYQNYTCPRTGLMLCIPLGNGPYVVQKPHPDYTEIGRTWLIDEAFALIAAQPTDPCVRIPPRQTPEAQAEYWTLRAREAALRPSRPVFLALDGRAKGGRAGRDKPTRSGRDTGGAGEDRDGADTGSGGTAAGIGDGARPVDGPTRRFPPWVYRAAALVAGAAAMALLVWLVASELPPMLILPALYVTGLGSFAVLVVGAVAGACWGIAASTWLAWRNAGMVLAGGAFGAIASGLLVSPDHWFGAWVPAYGALAVASLVSAVLDHSRLHPSALVVLGGTGAVTGALLAQRWVGGEPLRALWLTAIALHGLMAVGAIWARLRRPLSSKGQREA